MSPRRLTAVLGLFLLCVSPVLAQSDRGSITGRVKDQAGAVVPNAKVTATNVQTNEAREATTNDEGNFTIPQLPASIYTIKAEAAGFKLAVVEDVKVAVQVTRSEERRVGKECRHGRWAAGRETHVPLRLDPAHGNA